MTIKRCAGCGKARKIHRRGYCQPCYRAYLVSPAYTPAKRGGIRPAVDGSLRSIGKALKISHVTVRHALEVGRLTQTEAGWQYTPGQPGRPKK
jgi:hypothetical protein